ncbi:UPF0424 protein [Mycena indigotica]|uniref:UPF0424 protein n=1 Tax=Mycena indigotica TaxID=2126181 RepID=A0A8H6WFX9_9AGAR|nr:UPF0424 protein [Mycena indigotica]KAF7316232.1 UPF0424 protein [Mycena indigotica]
MADSSNSNSNLIGSELSNLYEFIDKDNVHGLNLAVPEDAREIVKVTHAEISVAMSEIQCSHGINAKAQINLLNQESMTSLYCTFRSPNTFVRLKSILLKLGRGEVTPRQLRIYANHPTIVDFADAENTTPHLNVSLLEGETGVVEYPFRVAAFASVTSLSLFFSDSVGGDVSRIYYLGFKGESKSTHREGTSKLEIPAANAADASLVDRVAEKTAGSQTTAR